MEYWLDSVDAALNAGLRLMPAVATLDRLELRSTGADKRCWLPMVWRMLLADSRISRAASTALPNSLNEAPQASGKSIK